MAAGRGTGGAAGNGSAAKKLAGKEEEECAICHAGLESDCLATVCAHRCAGVEGLGLGGLRGLGVLGA